MKIAVTGPPGIGKTTLCLRVYEALAPRFRISGFVTKEVRDKNRRIGFILKNLETGNEEWLARVGEGKVKVGRYVVFIENLESFLKNLNFSTSNFIIIDEIGPMELKSKKFVEMISNVINSKQKNVLVTYHYRLEHKVIKLIKNNFKLFFMNKRNRDFIAGSIIDLYDKCDKRGES